MQEASKFLLCFSTSSNLNDRFVLHFLTAFEFSAVCQLTL